MNKAEYLHHLSPLVDAAAADHEARAQANAANLTASEKALAAEALVPFWELSYHLEKALRAASKDSRMNTIDQTFDRSTGIGASEAALALGLAPASWGSSYDLYMQKTGQAPGQPPSRFLEWGNRLEEPVAQWYADETGLSVVPVATTRHPSIPWLFATPDRMTVDRLVQIKNVSLDAYRAGEKWGPPDTGIIPVEYDVQTQIEMAVFGIPRNDLVILVGGNEPLVYPREANPEWQAELIDALAKFWKHIEDRVPPAPQTMENARELYPRVERPSVEASEQAISLLERLRNAQRDSKAIESEVDALKALLAQEIGDAELLLHPETAAVLATWKVVERKAYTVNASSSRVLRLK